MGDRGREWGRVVSRVNGMTHLVGGILGWLPGGEKHLTHCGGQWVQFQELWPGIHQDTEHQFFSFWDNGISSSSTLCKAVINLQALTITSQKPFHFGVVCLPRTLTF